MATSIKNPAAPVECASRKAQPRILVSARRQVLSREQLLDLADKLNVLSARMDWLAERVCRLEAARDEAVSG